MNQFSSITQPQYTALTFLTFIPVFIVCFLKPIKALLSFSIQPLLEPVHYPITTVAINYNARLLRAKTLFMSSGSRTCLPYLYVGLEILRGLGLKLICS